MLARLDEHADLHRNEVENPCDVLRALGQLARLTHVFAAPNSLKIDRLGTEGLVGKGIEHRESGLARHKHEITRLISAHVVIDKALTQQTLAVFDDNLGEVSPIFTSLPSRARTAAFFGVTSK